MVDDDPAFLRLPRPTHHELVYVGPNGTTTWGFGYQPTTEDIADYTRHAKGSRYCVQLIGDIYEVYDLKTLKPFARSLSHHTIGVPVFRSEDPDAAIMWALMNL